ncbi:MAG: TIGR02206 family membrane protein [Proteobacteria bacterium]|nr:TIGR02206 family membrane protein [Pseudomonadota bacterium]
MAPRFILFGPAHLSALALSVAVPLLLALWVRPNASRDYGVRMGLATLLIAGWLGWYAMLWHRGWLAPGNALPLNLCDWAQAALIAALLTRSQRAYELGYFWGLGGTLQAVTTPDLPSGFPDPQFLLFMLDHAGLIAALLYMTWGSRMRPLMSSLPRVILATLIYAAAAGIADYALGTNYGFLRGKGDHVSLLTFLAPWPWYIGELVAIGLVSVAVYYAPFWLLDRFKRPKISTS